MVASPEVPRNAEGVQSEGRAPRRWIERSQRQYKGRSPKAPAQSLRVLLAEVPYHVPWFP
jgi:hypothetical protein